VVLAEPGRGSFGVAGTGAGVIGCDRVAVGPLAPNEDVAVGSGRSTGGVSVRVEAFVDDVDVWLLVVVRHARKVSQSTWTGGRIEACPENIGSSGLDP